MRKILRTFAFFSALMFLSGCASIRGSGLSILPSNWGNEEGYIWCNARYLDIWAYPNPIKVTPPKDVRLTLASRGYIYALAAGLTLQKPGESEDKHFRAPEYLIRDKALEVNKPNIGFQASTFTYRDPSNPTRAPEIIVAFRGSDEWTDYWKHNFALWSEPEQYAPARDYVKRVAAVYPGWRLVVAGFSLGGGLAVHVILHEDTSSLVAEAWALNPSPRIGVEKRQDPRIFMAAVEGELLEIFRSGGMGATNGHFSNKFGLINSSSVYGHSRWVLMRQMLYFADFVEYEKSGRQAQTTPPLEIILNSNVPKGCTPKILNELSKHGESHKRGLTQQVQH
jgi:hypothetical protein